MKIWSKENPIKQVKIYEFDNGAYHGGIQLQNGDVICGCCGWICPKNKEGVLWKLVKVYDNWVDLTKEICGDDLNE